MSHQFRILLTSEDVPEIEQLIQSIAPVCFFRDNSDRPIPHAVPTLDVLESAKPWLFYYLAPLSEIDSIVMRPISAQTRWSIDFLRSPVIEFTRSYIDGASIRPGRLFYKNSFYAADDSLQYKSDEFQKWAKQIFGVVKNRLTKMEYGYAGRHAQKLVSTGAYRVLDD